MKSPHTLTQREIAARWGCNVRTVRRALAAHNIEPTTYAGLEPVLTFDQLLTLETRRLRARRLAIAKLRARPVSAAQVLSVKQAKGKAGR